MECICLISLPQQENTKQPHGGIESWQLNFPPLFIIQWQSFKMTPGTQKMNDCVTSHAVVVDSVCLHLLSINIAGCLLKEIWAHAQILLDRKCVYLSCNSWFDLSHLSSQLRFSGFLTSENFFLPLCKQVLNICITSVLFSSLNSVTSVQLCVFRSKIKHCMGEERGVCSALFGKSFYLYLAMFDVTK